MKMLTVVGVLLFLQGCTSMVVGTAVGVATTVAVETVKAPVRIAGAVIDAATDDEDDQFAGGRPQNGQKHAVQ